MLKLSEAASLALHTMVYLSNSDGEKYSTREIAERLNVSEAHLSKVLQRLARQGLVRSIRGPKGGFALNGRHEDISLREIYEAIEGPMEKKHCFHDTELCRSQDCIFGGLVTDLSSQVVDYMTETRLLDLVGKMEGVTQVAASKDS